MKETEASFSNLFSEEAKETWEEMENIIIELVTQVIVRLLIFAVSEENVRIWLIEQTCEVHKKYFTSAGYRLPNPETKIVKKKENEMPCLLASSVKT